MNAFFIQANPAAGGLPAFFEGRNRIEQAAGPRAKWRPWRPVTAVAGIMALVMLAGVPSTARARDFQQNRTATCSASQCRVDFQGPVPGQRMFARKLSCRISALRISGQQMEPRVIAAQLVDQDPATEVVFGAESVVPEDGPGYYPDASPVRRGWVLNDDVLLVTSPRRHFAVYVNFAQSESNEADCFLSGEVSP